MDLMSVMTLLETIGKTTNKLDSIPYTAIKSKIQNNIVKISKDLIVSPPVIISNSLKHHEQIDNALRVVVETFASFYTQAFAVLSNVKSISIVKSNIDTLKTGLESDFSGFATDIGFLEIDNLGMEDNKRKYAYTGNMSKVQMSHVGLSVEVELAVNDLTVKLPIVINPVIMYANPVDVVKMATGSMARETVVERFFEWRSGGIGFLDFILGLDIIRNYYKLRVKNDNEAIKKYLDTINAKYTKTLVNSTPNSSLNTIYIVTKQEANEIAKIFGGKLTLKTVRNKFFDRTMSIFLCYLDDEWEEAVIYIDSIDSETRIPYRRLVKRSNENAIGMDLTKIFTDLVLGRPPKF